MGIYGNYIIEAKSRKLPNNIKTFDLHSTDAKSYIESDEYLGNLKNNNRIKDFNGEIIVDEETKKVVGRFLIGTGKDEGFIGAVRVADSYQGKGLGYKLLDDAVKKYNGIDLVVLKDNKIAYNMYKNYGFVVIKILGKNKNEYYMKLKTKLSKDDNIININD